MLKQAFLLLLAAAAVAANPRRLDAATFGSDVPPIPSSVDRRIYVGMWTFHFRDMKRGLDQNWLVGVSWGRVYGATFVNSFGNRAYTAGLQGDWRETTSAVPSLGVGYGVGLGVNSLMAAFVGYLLTTPVGDSTIVTPFTSS